jgi:predicted  nucleic acid-binding Zn-ribbon protein
MPDTIWTDDNGEQHNISELIREVKELRHDSENHHARLDTVESEVGDSIMDDPEDSGCRMELEKTLERINELESRVGRLLDKQNDTEYEIRSVETSVQDERSDRERADDAIKSDVDSLRNDLMYGR